MNLPSELAARLSAGNPSSISQELAEVVQSMLPSLAACVSFILSRTLMLLVTRLNSIVVLFGPGIMISGGGGRTARGAVGLMLELVGWSFSALTIRILP